MILVVFLSLKNWSILGAKVGIKFENTELLIQHHLPASSFSIRKMQKAFPPIDNRLIEWQAALEQDLQQLFRTGCAVTIGGLAFCMLARGNAAHQAVYFLIPKTAGDGNGFAYSFPKWLQQMIY